MEAESWHTVTVRIPFFCPEHALLAKRAIEVDGERQPKVVRRTLKVEDEVLVATFSTLTVRLARLVVNAFLENVDLVVRTLEAFGEDATASSSGNLAEP